MIEKVEKEAAHESPEEIEAEKKLKEVLGNLQSRRNIKILLVAFCNYIEKAPKVLRKNKHFNQEMMSCIKTLRYLSKKGKKKHRKSFHQYVQMYRSKKVVDNDMQAVVAAMQLLRYKQFGISARIRIIDLFV